LREWFVNIAFPLRLRGVGRKQRLRVAEDLVRRFASGIQPTKRCDELSGGQQQMVSLLRSFAAEADLLLLDEPLAALDQQTSWDMTFHLERVWLWATQLKGPALKEEIGSRSTATLTLCRIT
jgi:ABC-type nitrate/sulfonate/bicarbonate transport system ATPase subunit